MGHAGRNRPWASGPFGAFGPFGPGFGGFGGPGGSGGQGGPGGPAGGVPPWMAGLFGLGQTEKPRGPQVRRGDVRSAILDVLATAAREEEPINGYQVIGRIDERTHGAWRPSPGSVYPTVQQLQDEGLVEADEERGRRTLRLTQAGLTYVDHHRDELRSVWAPFEKAAAAAGVASGHDAEGGEEGSVPDLKSEIGQMMSAVWQIVTSGSDGQRRAALGILVDTRRRLYGVLADGHDAEVAADRSAEDDDPAT